MTRQDRYKHSLAMSRRLFELKDIHSWSSQEVALALSLLDEAVALSMHVVG
jgi:acyl-CoA oxidase